MERIGRGMWRYREVLPAVEPVSLGEGGTPLLRSRRYPGLWIKDEGANPGGSWLARGFSVAVSQARAEGRQRVRYGGAAADVAAMYAAAAGLTLVVPRPDMRVFEERVGLVLFGAQAGDADEELVPPVDKTLGLELQEEMPDGEAVIVPRGLAGPGAKWIGAGPEILVADEPGSPADAVRWARQEGLALSPGGVACAALYERMLADGRLGAEARVVLVNPEAAWRDAAGLASLLGVRRPVPLPVSLPVGGIITPI